MARVSPCSRQCILKTVELRKTWAIVPSTFPQSSVSSTFVLKKSQMEHYTTHTNYTSILIRPDPIDCVSNFTQNHSVIFYLQIWIATQSTFATTAVLIKTMVSMSQWNHFAESTFEHSVRFSTKKSAIHTTSKREMYSISPIIWHHQDQMNSSE